MRKLIAGLAAAAILVLPATAGATEVSTNEVSTNQEAGVGWGGQYGPSSCYVWLEYFRVDASVQSTYPYVIVNRTGAVGGHVVCPI